MQVNSYFSGYLQRWPSSGLLLYPGRSSRVLAAALLHLGLAAAAGDGADHPGRHPLHVHVQRPQVNNNNLLLIGGQRPHCIALLQRDNIIFISEFLQSTKYLFTGLISTSILTALNSSCLT